MNTIKDIRKNMIKNEIDGTDINGNYYMDPLYTWQPIRRCGNDLYFYADVDQYSQLCAIQLLNDIQSEIISRNAIKIIDGVCTETITIHINSCGGYLSSGLALYDFIKNLKVHVTGVVEGVAMSAATLILLACDERKMGDNSVVLLHQLSGIAAGTYLNIKDNMINVERAMCKLRHIYIEETDIGMEEVTPDDTEDLIIDKRLDVLESLLMHDLELDKDTCLDYGIISKELEEVTLTDEDNEEIHKFIEKIAEKRIRSNKKEHEHNHTKKEKEKENTVTETKKHSSSKKTKK